ncbi:MAG: 2-dehydropantoate 2-reductase [Chloroflexota bacterium]
MDVLVVGAGGVGGYLGGLLARAGHRLSVVARGASLEALSRQGLRVESVADGTFTVPVEAVPTAPQGRTTDLVLFTVKEYDTQGAIEQTLAGVGPHTQVLTLQNGVVSADHLAAAFGRERVLEGLIYIESYVKAPGVIAQEGGPRRVVFGKRSGNGAREQALLGTLREAGWQAELADDIITALWAKLCFIGPFAALNTLTGLRGPLLAGESVSGGVARALIGEYVAVATAEGARLPADMVDATLERMRTFMGLASMLRDRVAGRRLESDALVDDVVRRAASHSIPVPVATMLAALLAPVREGGSPALGA